jgi:PAS domain S-box-containing protein
MSDAQKMPNGQELWNVPVSLENLIYRDPLVVDFEIPVMEAIARLHLHQSMAVTCSDSSAPDCILVTQDTDMAGLFTSADLVPLLASGADLTKLPIGQVAHPAVVIQVRGDRQLVLADIRETSIPASSSPYRVVKDEDQQLCGIIAEADFRWFMHGLQSFEHERQQFEVAFQESERRLQAIINGSPACIYVKDLEGRYTLVNQLCAIKKQLTPESMCGKTDLEIVTRDVAEEWQAQDREVLRLKKAIELEEVLVWNGHQEAYLTLKFPLFDGAGNPYAVCGISANITQRKRTENEILASLRRKDLVIQEIHHRIKNNLQIISSLMTLQSRLTNDAAIVRLFKDCQNRILSIALIHEQLYQSRDLTNINMAEYIRNLADQVIASYQGQSQAIDLELNLAEVFLNLDTALPCGLLITELLSNSLKYAFLPQQKGQIYIQLYLEMSDQISLIVGDNGVGLPANFDFRKSRSLGLQLVCDLAGQLKGCVTLLPGKGTAFKLTFIESKSRARL